MDEDQTRKCRIVTAGNPDVQRQGHAVHFVDMRAECDLLFSFGLRQNPCT